MLIIISLEQIDHFSNRNQFTRSRGQLLTCLAAVVSVRGDDIDTSRCIGMRENDYDFIGKYLHDLLVQPQRLDYLLLRP